jgi:hypothetical protein
VETFDEDSGKIRCEINRIASVARGRAGTGLPECRARWRGKDDRLRLEGWSRYSRIVILRRRIESELALSEH